MKSRTNGIPTPLLPAARHSVRLSGRGERTLRSTMSKQLPVTILVRWVNPQKYAFVVQLRHELAMTAWTLWRDGRMVCATDCVNFNPLHTAASRRNESTSSINNERLSMNVTTEPTTQQLYRCKDVSCPFTETPKHGSVAWRYDGIHWSELRFWHKPPNQTGWVPADEFSRVKEETRQHNIEFFRTHPADLRRKIDLKRRGARLLRSLEFSRPYALPD